MLHWNFGTELFVKQKLDAMNNVCFIKICNTLLGSLRFFMRQMLVVDYRSTGYLGMHQGKKSLVQQFSPMPQAKIKDTFYSPDDSP